MSVLALPLGLGPQISRALPAAESAPARKTISDRPAVDAGAAPLGAYAPAPLAGYSNVDSYQSGGNTAAMMSAGLVSPPGAHWGPMAGAQMTTPETLWAGDTSVEADLYLRAEQGNRDLLGTLSGFGGASSMSMAALDLKRSLTKHEHAVLLASAMLTVENRSIRGVIESIGRS